jgi:O-antigen/teichoic acid export membrane protein
MLAGQAGVKIVAFFGTLAAVRALGPSELGEAGLVLAAAGVLGVLLNMGADIVGPRLISEAAEEREKKNVAVNLFVLRGLITAISFLVLPVYVILKGRPDLWGVALIGALVMTFNSMNPQFAFQGFGKVDRLSIVQILTSIFALPAYLAVAFLWPKAEGFLLAQAVGAALAFLLGMRILQLLPCSFSELHLGQTLRSLVSSESRSAWLGNITIFAFGQGDVLSVSIFCNNVELGNFNAALSLIGATNSLLIIVPTVVYARQLRWIREGADSFRHKQTRLLMAIFAAGAVGSVVAYLAGVPAARLMLGKAFTLAPVIFGIILAVSLVNLSYSVMVTALNAAGKTWRNVRVTLMIAAVSLVAYPVSAICWGVHGVLVAKCGLLLLMLGVQFFVYRSVLSEVSA